MSVPCEVKTCTKCGAEKPVGEFSRDAQKRDGRRPSCRACNPSRSSPERDREYYAANKERIRVRKMARYHADPSTLLAQSKASRRKNATRALAREQVYRANNRARRNEQSAAYSKSHPEARRAYEALRRARKRGQSVADRKAFLEYAKWTRTALRVPCYWCGKPTGKKARHIDHIIPLARGGTNAVANLCVACPTCNSRKGAKLPADFAGQSEMAFA